MPVLRLLLIVLVLLNLLALAAIQGWLGSTSPRGEPERLTNQINPGVIVLNPPEPLRSTSAPVPAPTGPTPSPTPASAPAPRAEEVPTAPARTEEVAVEPPAAPPRQATDADRSLACFAYAGLDEADAQALERISRDISPDIRTSLQMIDPPSAWWVRIPPAASRQIAERKVVELRGLGITDLFIVRDPGPNQNAISLGLFRTKSSARQHLADLETRRVRGAEIAARNPAVYQIEVSGPASALTLLAERVASDLPDARRGECNP
jgi:hypothetical protein